MKGVVLAGGTGTRLYPLTRLINKHLLPVGKYPMILYGLESFAKQGLPIY
ncbi:Glucose-1-phosphate thymidylyltransferase [Paenibacillus sp. P1XP2]|nr:Glucose-1-phosphate thymidylyltransferase [Paenibacillus sp. P1XP2]